MHTCCTEIHPGNPTAHYDLQHEQTHFITQRSYYSQAQKPKSWAIKSGKSNKIRTHLYHF